MRRYGLRPTVSLLLVIGCSNETEVRPRSSQELSIFHHDRAALAASFLGGDSTALQRLLHESVIVQPPAPDSARQGQPAIAYLLELAENTAVQESSLEPSIVVPEGPFLFEQGTWFIRAGHRLLRSNYSLRWRDTPHGLRVVLWSWSRFR